MKDFISGNYYDFYNYKDKESGMRLGGFLFSILMTLIVLAIVGLVDWGTVGGWVKVMVYIWIGGLLLLGLGMLFTKSDK